MPNLNSESQENNGTQNANGRPQRRKKGKSESLLKRHIESQKADFIYESVGGLTKN